MDNINKNTIMIEELLRKINKRLNKYTKNHIKCYNLTLSRFYVLRIIKLYQPINMGELHKHLQIAGSTLTVIVDYLVDADLVKRYRNPGDRRVVLLEITDKGDKILKGLLNIKQKFLQNCLDDISLDNKQELIYILQTIYNNIEKHSKAGDNND